MASGYRVPSIQNKVQNFNQPQQDDYSSFFQNIPSPIGNQNQFGSDQLNALSSFGTEQLSNFIDPQNFNTSQFINQDFVNPNDLSGSNKGIFGGLFPNTANTLDNLGGIDPSTKKGFLENNFTRPDGSLNFDNIGTGLNVLSAGGKLLLGLKQYGDLKNQLKENKLRYNQNFNAQKNITNRQIEDQAASRVAANPNAQSVASVLAKYGIK